MKRTTRGATATLLALALAGCGGSASTAATREASSVRETSPAVKASDFSVYDLGSTWTDQTGTARELASLGGRVQVVAMVYTYCGHTCPLILGELKRVEGALSPEEGKRVGFTLVSMDPARDTPTRLAEYAVSSRLDTARWTLLTAPDEQVRDLAALLGIRYREEGGGVYSHSNTYFVLDAAGRIVHRHEGLGLPPEGVLAAIRGALP